MSNLPNKFCTSWHSGWLAGPNRLVLGTDFGGPGSDYVIFATGLPRNMRILLLADCWCKPQLSWYCSCWYQGCKCVVYLTTSACPMISTDICVSQLDHDVSHCQPHALDAVLQPLSAQNSECTVVTGGLGLGLCDRLGGRRCAGNVKGTELDKQEQKFICVGCVL